MSTRDQILEAAWKLFSEHGFEDVSVRDLTNEAGVNLASVSYHFGGKDGVIQEVIKMVLNPGHEKRLEMLAAIIEEKGGVDNVSLRQLLECYLRPWMFPEQYGCNEHLLARLTARYLIDRDYVVPATTSMLFTEVYKRYITAIQPKASHLDQMAIMRRLLYCTGALLHFKSFSGPLVKLAGVDNACSADEDFMAIVDFCLAGFSK